MPRMQPVLWTKGLLLTPQHLQAQDRFLKDTFEFRLSAYTFCPWGFSALEIDREDLAQGDFSVTTAAGIFPDGLIFDVGADLDPAPKKIPLGDAFGPDQTELRVYLAIPERRVGGLNVAGEEAGGRARYLAEAIWRRDETTGESERPIQVGSKNLSLRTESENLDGYSVLPIANVIRSATGELSLDAGFAAPTLDIQASPYLTEVAKRLVELLTAKSATLSGMRRERKKGLADFGVSDVANFWLLYSVNTYLPEIRHIYEVRRGHPEQLFQAMLALAGALTTFSTRITPADLPAYDHGDLGRSFADLDHLLRDLLETVVPSTHVSLPMKGEGDRHAVAIDQDRYFSAPEMLLAIRSDLGKEELLRRVVEFVKVSSADRLDHLVNHQLPGVDLRHVPDPPRALPLKMDYEYFRLDRAGDVWEEIRRARNIAAHVPDLPGAKLELMILLPEG